MDAEQMVKEFTDQLKEQKATIVELEKQLGNRKEQVLRLEGAIEANRKMDQIPDFPEHLRKAITHMLHAHHGEWSPIKPKSLEAITLHHIDYLFSRLDPCFESLEDREGEWGKEKLKALGNGYAWIGAAPVEE